MKLAVAVLETMGAIEVVMTEKKLKGGVPEPFDFWCVQVYYHTIADRLGAGSNGGASTFNFHKAKATRSKGRAGFSYGT